MRKEQESGAGAPQSKTLRAIRRRVAPRQVVECGSPLPLCGGRGISPIGRGRNGVVNAKHPTSNLERSTRIASTAQIEG